LESKRSPKRTPGTPPAVGIGLDVHVQAPLLFASDFSPELSSPIKTRHSRQIGPKPLIPLDRSMSGRPDFPTSNPTNSSQKPDKSTPDPLRLSESSQYSECRNWVGVKSKTAPCGCVPLLSTRRRRASLHCSVQVPTGCQPDELAPAKSRAAT